MNTMRPVELEAFKRFAVPAPEMGRGVYRLTSGPSWHAHYYYMYCPWNDAGDRMLLLRYTPEEPEAEVCSLRAGDGEIEPLGTTRAWSTHGCAGQMWVGDHVLYEREAREDGTNVFCLREPGGAERLFETHMQSIEGVRGNTAYGPSSWDDFFPGNAPGDRRATGIVGLDLRGGGQETVCSLERVIEATPLSADLSEAHILLKQLELHPARNMALFVATNQHSRHRGFDADLPLIKYVFAYDFAEDALVCVGDFGHHPKWHPSEPWILSYTPDANGAWRLIYDKLGADGAVERQWLDYFSSTGHPSVSPEGSRILTDNYSKAPGEVVLDAVDPSTGRASEIARYAEGADSLNYPHKQSAPFAGETMAAHFRRIELSPDKKIVVQAHPVWDRTGRYVAFNANPDGPCQLYFADLEELVGEGG